MKEEIFNALTSWHQEQKKLLNQKEKFVSAPLEIATLQENITTEFQAAQAFSQTLGTYIQPSTLFWGMPYSQHTPSNLKLSCGYVMIVANLGWLLIWKYSNKILFLDKNLFGMGKSFDFCSQQLANSKQNKNIKIRIIITLILILLIILYILVK